jgi:hypothetical protein
MAQNKIKPENGKYKLGGSKDADLEGIDDNKYDVFTETEKLEKARSDFPMYDWFVSYVIKDKDGHEVRDLPEYMMKIDKPDSPDSKLYYYLDGSAHLLSYDDTDDKGNKKRVKAKLTVGDPPNGLYP